MTQDDRPLRTTFDEVAELYDLVRPSYPDALFDDLAALAPLRPGARILEIGCGTGQATVPLAASGYRVTCIELGEALSVVARRRLSSFPNAEVITGAFESWQPATEAFDAVVAFTSFHWIDPTMRYAKAASLLRPAGALGVVTTHHVLPADGDDFFQDVQRDYEAILPDDPATIAGGPVDPDLIEGIAAEIEASGEFAGVEARRYVWDVTYSADEYVRLLETYSGHRALDDETRGRLVSRIRERIERRPGERVRKSYLAILTVAHRR